jgi:hypothetical protein
MLRVVLACVGGGIKRKALVSALSSALKYTSLWADCEQHNLGFIGISCVKMPNLDELIKAHNKGDFSLEKRNINHTLTKNDILN